MLPNQRSVFNFPGFSGLGCVKSWICYHIHTMRVPSFPTTCYTTIFGTLCKQWKQCLFDYVLTGKNKHPATLLSVYFLDMLVMDPFQVYFTQNRYFCFYFLTLTFVFVPSLAYDKGVTVTKPLRGSLRDNWRRKKHPGGHFINQFIVFDFSQYRTFNSIIFVLLTVHFDL